MAAIGSILLASTAPDALRAWYARVFDVTPDPGDGILWIGEVALIVTGRDDIAAAPVEPARVLVNVHVDDARTTAARLDDLGVTWIAAVEYREPVGAWFGTLQDPDGNYVQIVEPTAAYWAARPHRRSGTGPLASAKASGRLPCQDLDRARRWYADKLGLEPVEERPGGLRYQCASGSFSLYGSAGRPSGEFTQFAFQVADIEAAVAELRGRGVEFETVEIPGLETVDGIAEVEGNYPSAGGKAERAAWFRDSEGNLLGMGEPVR